MLALPPAGEMEMFVLFCFKFRPQTGGKKGGEAQDQSSLTSHFFVCKIFWDRRGGHSQPMVLLGILKETRGHGGMNRHLKPSCESWITEETAGMVAATQLQK